MACALALSAGSRTDFTGKWTFDRVEAQNPPQALDSYTLSVTQGQREITVDSKIEADAMAGGRGSGGRSPDDSAGGGRQRGGGRSGGGMGRSGGIGFPGGGLGLPGSRRGGTGGGGGYPGGGGGGTAGRTRPQGQGGGFSALATVVPSATYTLDEKETTANVAGRFPGEAKLKTKWKNDGKVLELSMVQKTRDGKKITTTERWELEDGGRVLRVERSVEGARGKDKLKLTFKKLASEEQPR